MPKVSTLEARQQGERFLRLLDTALADSQTDKRWAAIARTHIEQAVMAACRAIAPAPREPLPEDAPAYDETCQISKDVLFGPPFKRVPGPFEGVYTVPEGQFDHSSIIGGPVAGKLGGYHD